MERGHKAEQGAGCLNEEVAWQSEPEADPRADDEPGKWGRQQTRVGGGVTSPGLLAQLAAAPQGDARPGPCAELGRSSRVTQKPHCAELGRSGHQRSRKHVLSEADGGSELLSSPRCSPRQTHISSHPLDTSHIPRAYSTTVPLTSFLGRAQRTRLRTGYSASYHFRLHSGSL